MIQKLEEICRYAYSFKETVYHTFETAKELSGIDGDFVECGVAGGAQIMAMNYAIADTNSNKKIYAFDSFEGIPMAGEFDVTQPGIGEIAHNKFAPLSERLVSSGITVHSQESVVTNFSNVGISDDNVVYIKGWFQNTLPVFAESIDKISLLRLDGDLYESTLICLEYLYPKVVEGGVVIVDDYALEGARKAISDYFNGELPKMIEVNGGGGVAYFYKKNNQ